MGLVIARNEKGKILSTGRNLLTKIGREWWAERWAYDIPPTYASPADKMELGDGITPVTEDDTTLDNSVKTSTGFIATGPFTPAWFSDFGVPNMQQNSFGYRATFFGSTHTYSEGGILVSGAPDLLLARWLFDEPFVCLNSMTFTIDWVAETN